MIRLGSGAAVLLFFFLRGRDCSAGNLRAGSRFRFLGDGKKSRRRYVRARAVSEEEE